MHDEPTIFSDLTAEVEIPPDGTLSRVLYRDDRIRVVVFGFDAGQELTEHTAASPAVVEVVTGRIRLSLGEAVTEVGPGSWVHMPAQLPHAIEALVPSVMLLTLLRTG
jgi:quercetin dioxygenase-like cupin family protein